MTRAALAAVSALVLAAGCSSDDDSAGPTDPTGAPITTITTAVDTSVTATSSPETSAPGTSAPASTAPTTSAPDTSTATTGVATTDTAPCDFVGAQTEQRFEFPNLMTSEIGADIRTGIHECYERIVIELQLGVAPTEAGMPGWLVRYAEGPVTLGQSDDQFVELEGEADLLITMNAWMSTFDVDGNAVGYSGPRDIRPTNTRAILQLQLVDDFEGQHTWAVGLDQRRDFRVFMLTAPDRLVVDIAT